MNEAYNIDCMEFMRRVPSKYFDLAVVDPPYGIEKGFKETSRVRRYGQTKTANDDIPAYKDTEISARSFFEVEHSKELAALEQAARRKRLIALTY